MRVFFIWRKSHSLLFCCTCTSNKLRKSLGKWHNTGPIRQRWTYFVDLSSQCLLHIPVGKSIFRCYLPAHLSQVFHPKGTVTFSHPVTILPVTVAQQNDSLITITARPLHSHGYTHQTDSTSQIHRAIMSSLPQHLGKLAMTLWSAMGHCFFPTNISDLVTEYNNHTLWPLQATDQLSKMMLCMHGYSLVHTQRPVHMVMGLFLGEDRHCHRFGLKFVGLLDAC